MSEFIPVDEDAAKENRALTYSENSKTGAVSQPAMTGVRAHSSPPSVSPLSLYGGFDES